MFEIDDPLRRARVLATWAGSSASVPADRRRHHRRRAQKTGALARAQASSVQFIRFPFTAAQIAAFRGGAGDVIIGFDHPNYGHMAVMPPAVRQALAQDFA